MKQHFHSNGKLLISGEYVILDGALGLALPTTYGQTLEVSSTKSKILKWESKDHNSNIWFEAEYDLNTLGSQAKRSETSDRLVQILAAAKVLNPDFLKDDGGCIVKSRIDFPIHWGLGTSSTLVNNIADWARVDPYQLLAQSFGGSGYDIACAQSSSPLLYQLVNATPKIREVLFDPPFKEQLYFVYLNKKQDSREGISEYRNRVFDKDLLLTQISKITEEIVACAELEEFERLLMRHESLLSKTLGLSSVKTSLFYDFNGAIKSLGAWGGDFILATGGNSTQDYFKRKGYEVVIPYQKMVLSG